MENNTIFLHISSHEERVFISELVFVPQVVCREETRAPFVSVINQAN
jgi:hypothetical protein